MALVTLDLPTPREMRGCWAACAAVLAACGWEQHCRAAEGVWHYDDGGGNWADLHHLGGGRAVLIGHDHEYSETHYAPAADDLEPERTDLLAGAPEWWEPPVRETLRRQERIGFVYGFDGSTWYRAAYDEDDGFTAVDLPACDPQRTREHIIEHCEGDPDRPQGPSYEAVDALIAADGAVTEALVADVTGRDGRDPAAGVAAARAFLTV